MTFRPSAADTRVLLEALAELLTYLSRGEAETLDDDDGVALLEAMTAGLSGVPHPMRRGSSPASIGLLPMRGPPVASSSRTRSTRCWSRWRTTTRRSRGRVPWTTPPRSRSKRSSSTRWSRSGQPTSPFRPHRWSASCPVPLVPALLQRRGAWSMARQQPGQPSLEANNSRPSRRRCVVRLSISRPAHPCGRRSARRSPMV